VILGREMGLDLELSEVRVESLVPPPLRDCSIDDFIARLPGYDCAMRALLEESRQAGQVLRYVARLTAAGEATVALERLDASHAFANIALTDNVVRFATDRYCDNALVVQGPGAGPAVTAAGVFSDLLRLAAGLGAHL
jgi:aspartokinase/homoserine dehydrogenase 1